MFSMQYNDHEYVNISLVKYITQEAKCEKPMESVSSGGSECVVVT